MAVSGWQVNLSGQSVPVYKLASNGSCSSTKIGNITKNECFIEGTVPGTGWEGDANPVVICDASHKMVMGGTKDYVTNGNFSEYASNGTSWVKVSTRERKVVAPTVCYYKNGTKCCDLAIGSKVVLGYNCTRGQNNMNYCAVQKVTTASGKVYDFVANGQDHAFIDLTYGGRWVNVGSILLRKI